MHDYSLGVTRCCVGKYLKIVISKNLLLFTGQATPGSLSCPTAREERHVLRRHPETGRRSKIKDHPI